MGEGAGGGRVQVGGGVNNSTKVLRIHVSSCYNESVSWPVVIVTAHSDQSQCSEGILHSAYDMGTT